MDRVNLFNPFSSPPVQHENRLTWAFLIALKYAPSFQNFFRGLVEAKLPMGDRVHGNFWDPARISTQTKGIESPTSRLVSILLTNKTHRHIPVDWSNREPKYDGVIEYPDGLTLIVENKPSSDDVWDEQLWPSRRSFSSDHISKIDLHPSAICLEWSDILEEVLKYTDSGMDSFANREIFRDFLSFVEKYHDGLTPYRTFRLCSNRQQAINRRARMLVDKLGSQVNLESREGWYLFRPNKIAERVGIWVEPKLTLKVNLWPANTVTQARRFYNEVNRTGFLGLEGWGVEPNLHFSFVSTPLISAKQTWPTDRYFDYFSNEELYGQKNIATLVPLVKQWESEGIITSDDLDKLNALFDKNYSTLNVNPGFSVSREWNLDTVIDLEERRELENHIIDALKAPLASWGEILSD